jgi:hypothetical protein
MSERDDGQLPLLEASEWWEEHWQDMPEFVQDDMEPFKTVHVHFANAEDLAAFAKLVGQTQIMGQINYMWYPPIPMRRTSHLRYVDEP